MSGKKNQTSWDSLWPEVHHIEKISIDNGLSSNIIREVYQGQRGFLWIATDFGLNRYDGQEITVFQSDTSPQSLKNNATYCLLQQDRNHILVGTKAGIAILNLNTFTFKNLQLASPGSKSGIDNQVQLLVQDKQRNIWACTPTSIFILDSTLRIKKKNHTQKNLVANRKTNVFKIIPLPNTDVLFWLSNGIYLWNSKSRAIEEIKANNSPYSFLFGCSFNYAGLVNDQYLVRLNEDQMHLFNFKDRKLHHLGYPERIQNGYHQFRKLWKNVFALKTEDNQTFLIRIKDNGHSIQLDDEAKQILPKYNISSIYLGKDGCRWVITQNKGLLKIAPAKQPFHLIQLTNSVTGRPISTEVTNIYPIDKSLLIGTYGDGYYQMDIPSGMMKHFSVKYDPYSENQVWKFWRADRNTVWIATQQGLLYTDLKNHSLHRLSINHPGVIDSVAITTLFEDSRGYVWMGLGRGNGVAMYDSKKKSFQLFPNKPGGYPFRYPLGAAEDGDGNVWFISDVTGLLTKWDRRTSTFMKVSVPGVNGDANFESGGLYIDKRTNTLWFGVQSIGLVRYEINTNKSVIYSKKEGLTASLILNIEPDKAGNLWLNTSGGIYCFDPDRAIAVNFKESDGLPGNYYSSNIYYDKADQIMYSGTTGLVTWFSTALLKKIKNDIPIYLTGVRINNKSIIASTSKKLTLYPDQNNLFIDFSGVNLNNGDENKYQYRIGEGSWVDLESRSEIRFANLNSGNYLIYARVAGKDKEYGKPHLLLSFYIRPYFTRTLWFYLLLLAAIIGLIYIWYRYRLNQLKQMGMMRSRISRDLHDEIGSKLTNINMMSQILKQKTLQPTESAILEKIQQESEEITQSMREIIWNIDPDNDTLEYAMPRLLSFASRLLESKNIEVEAQIGDIKGVQLDMEQRRDLFMIFKESIHNILKHSKADKVIIAAAQKGNEFSLTITDNGKGIIEKEFFNKSGLKYMYQRAANHHWDIRVSGSPDQGTKVILKMKI